MLEDILFPTGRTGYSFRYSFAVVALSFGILYETDSRKVAFLAWLAA